MCEDQYANAYCNFISLFSMQWVEVFKALLTPTIVGFGAYIAYQQWRNNRASLSEKLFDRRLQLFEKTKDLFRRLYLNDKLENIPYEFHGLASSAHFLFGAEMENYLHELGEKALRVYQLERSTNRQNVKQSRLDKELNELEKIRDWFYKEQRSLVQRFGSFMDFSDHKG